MDKKLKNNGITLISLVITMIIMLILVGVSINLAVNGGLIEYAGNAVGETKNVMEKEQGLIDDIIENYINTNVPIEGNDGEMFSPIYTENTTIKQGEYTATIPAGFAVGTSDGINKIENGLVIRDKDGNEFVWVPCTTDENNTGVTQYAQDKKYNDGTVDSKQYEYTQYKDWSEDVDVINENKKSIKENRGFYVARYEAGIPESASFYPNTEDLTYTYIGRVRNTDKYVPVSKKNNPSWNGISQKNAVIVSKKMYEGSASVTSGLIDSYAWDTIVNWMESKEEYKGIATNSTTYGNYVNSSLDLTNVLYAQHAMSNFIFTTIASTYVKGDLKIASRTLSVDMDLYELATGSLENAKVLNIYDMAGNMWEWTTETGDYNDGSYAVSRGGGYNRHGLEHAVTYRCSNETISSDRAISFRVVLYVK